MTPGLPVADLTELQRVVLQTAEDVIRLWELQADLPATPRADLRRAVTELLAAGLVDLVPTLAEDEHLSAENIHNYIEDDAQWLNMVENPWPKRGTIHDLVATEAGRAALR
jgi:hypothetical protein